MDEQAWPPDWQRGLFELIVLGAIVADGEPTYGYRIVQRLESAGFGKVKGGTLYPILARLEAGGLVQSHWGEGEGGPGRKFVAVTDAGRSHIRTLSGSWTSFARAVGDLVAEGARP